MRLFVAIELDRQVKAILQKVQEQLSRSCTGVRWLPGEQLHLTAKFLGDVADERVSAVCDGVASAASAQAGAFDMRVFGCGCFPPRDPVRIVWVGAQEASGALLRCVDALETQLERQGFPRGDRPFSPHITIGRAGRDRSAGRLRGAVGACSFEPVAQRVISIAVKSSVLSPQGPTYARVSTANLG